jgi:uncharacterized protein (DUF2336 family)
MSVSAVIIDELETALKVGSTDRRISVLRQITDLFADNAENFSPEQVALFDDVMGRLVREIEKRAVIELSGRIAPLPNAPTEIIRRLAWDDSIEVSAPVLAKSDRLTDGDLIELAQAKGQEHLAHIAARKTLNSAVTDVLVERGNKEVATKLASNAGAQFSETGMWQLVLRADGDDKLSEKVASRPDIPPHLFRQILSQATDKVRERLLTSAQPDTRRKIEKILADISVQFRKAVVSRDYGEAQRTVRSLGQDTERVKTELLTFARYKKLPELIAALSVLAAVPIELVEQLVHDHNIFGLLVLCKAVALDWTIMHAVILARPVAQELQSTELDEAYATYLKLSVSSAQRALRFWLVRKKVA